MLKDACECRAMFSSQDRDPSHPSKGKTEHRRGAGSTQKKLLDYITTTAPSRASKLGLL